MKAVQCGFHFILFRFISVQFTSVAVYAA